MAFNNFSLRNSLRRFVALLLIAASTAFAVRPSAAQTTTSFQTLNLDFCSAGCKTVAILIPAAIVGTILYFSLRAPRTTGCVIADANGLALRTDDGTRTYILLGETTTLKAGDRVKVLGRKKKDAAKRRTILVQKTLKDYGVCKAPPAPQPA